MNKRSLITAKVLDMAAQEEREYLAYAAPDLLRALLRDCPAALAWVKENAPEQAESVLLSLGTALELEAVKASELAPCPMEFA